MIENKENFSNNLKNSDKSIAKKITNINSGKDVFERLIFNDISLSKLHSLMNNPDFVDFFDSLINAQTDIAEPDIWKALISKCQNGDLNAIKFYFELKGKYKGQQKVNASICFREDVNE